MELNPGYKQTEVGVIPEDWDVSTVGREFEIKLGKMLDAERNTGGPKPYLGNKAIQWGRIDFNDLPTVPMTRADIESYRLREGDLLVCEGGEVGRAAIWHGPIDECYYQKAIHRLRALHGFEPSLMVGLLRRWADSGRLANYVTKTSIAHLPREKFLVITMPVPPQAEQRLISQVLCDLDALVAQLDGLIAKKRNIKQAAMQELLTGKRRLPGFEGEWEVKRLGDIAEITMGQSPSSTNYNTHGKGMPLIQGNADIKNRETVERVFTTQITKRGFKGDILMSVRAPVGEVSRATLDVCLGRGVCAIRFPNNFLYHCLIFLEPTWAKHSKGSTFDSVNSADLKAVDIHLPDESLEQIAIAEFLALMDAELATLEMRLTKAHALKQGMMQQLLTGKIRLT
jgi:type I restriction enzyme S subunit